MRVVVGLLVLLTVAGVLLAATLGTFFVGYVAQGSCTPDGESGSCLRTTVLPWTNVVGQVVLLVVSLAWGARLRRRAGSGAGAAGVTLALGLATVLVSAVVVGGLMVLADAGGAASGSGPARTPTPTPAMSTPAHATTVPGVGA